MHNTLFYRIKDIFTKTEAGWDQLAPSKDTAIDYAHNKLNQNPKRMIDTGSVLYHHTVQKKNKYSTIYLIVLYLFFNGYLIVINLQIFLNNYSSTLFTYKGHPPSGFSLSLLVAPSDIVVIHPSSLYRVYR